MQNYWPVTLKLCFVIYLLFCGVLLQCATFVGTVTYMSPERINNEPYSYPADIWSLGLALLECGTGEFPYSANKGPVNLMLQVGNIHLWFPSMASYFSIIRISTLTSHIYLIEVERFLRSQIKVNLQS